MKKTFRSVGLLLVIAMFTVGFGATAQVADVAILPMPSVSDEKEVVETPDNEPAAVAEDATAEVVEETDALADENAEVTDKPNALSEELWTVDELAALRELANERIQAKETLAELERVHGHVKDYVREIWRDTVEPFLHDLQEEQPESAEAPEHHDHAEHRHSNSFDRWMKPMELPDRDEVAAHWDKLVERFADSTGIAVEDAKEISAEWMEEQRELWDDIVEDIKELKRELRSVWFGESQGTADTEAPTAGSQNA